MGLLMKNVGPRKTIIIGLAFEMVQLAWYGFGSQVWMMWAAGILAALSSITYPAISSFVSIHADPDKQGIYFFAILHLLDELLNLTFSN
jgi:hypothetical protein